MSAEGTPKEYSYQRNAKKKQKELERITKETRKVTEGVREDNINGTSAYRLVDPLAVYSCYFAIFTLVLYSYTLLVYCM